MRTANEHTVQCHLFSEGMANLSRIRTTYDTKQWGVCFYGKWSSEGFCRSSHATETAQNMSQTEEHFKSPLAFVTPMSACVCISILAFRTSAHKHVTLFESKRTLSTPPLRTESQWAYLITVGVISAQKKMLKLPTAWEENMPMMEKAMEKFLFSVPELSAEKAGDTHEAIQLKSMIDGNTRCFSSVPQGSRLQTMKIIKGCP